MTNPCDICRLNTFVLVFKCHVATNIECILTTTHKLKQVNENFRAKFLKTIKAYQNLSCVYVYCRKCVCVSSCLRCLMIKG